HPSYRGVYTGYGVGLYLVKKAVDLLGGKITVSSEEGKGSCFTLAFNFPLAEEDAKEIGKPMDCISENATTKIKEVVLVVEDNDLVRHAIKIRLIHLGYDVMTVAEGKAALQALKTQPFSWVLLDIGLPDLSGTEVAQQYRQWERKNNKAYLPFFALTAHAGEKVEEKCYEAGIDYFLKKPLTEKDIKIIKQVIKKIKNDSESLINRK
ncbi:ATP-binding response regulator, partial [Rickettsiella grylli]|uniref:ATP-binding response regulator n=1 Tax=Rickettsiella grylli TaxID=59196 RepID=UPI000ACC3FF0